MKQHTLALLGVILSLACGLLVGCSDDSQKAKTFDNNPPASEQPHMAPTDKDPTPDSSTGGQSQQNPATP